MKAEGSVGKKAKNYYIWYNMFKYGPIKFVEDSL